MTSGLLLPGLFRRLNVGFWLRLRFGRGFSTLGWAGSLFRGLHRRARFRRHKFLLGRRRLRLLRWLAGLRRRGFRDTCKFAEFFGQLLRRADFAVNLIVEQLLEDRLELGAGLR